MNVVNIGMKINIKSKNLFIRNLRISDISNKYISALNNYEIVKYTEARHKTWNYNLVKENIIYSRKNKVPFLGIFLNDHTHIGNIRLPGHDKKNKRILLGIMVFDTSFNGKGYGTEALKHLSDYLLSECDINKITADYCIKNVASKRMFKKSNYKVEGILRKNLLIENSYEDTEIVSLNKKI